MQDDSFGSRFFITRPQPCPYLEGRVEQKVVTVLGRSGATAKYDLLNRNGFRRSHEILYRPSCPGCTACVPVRVIVDDFVPDRSLTRVWRRNADLIANEVPAIATREQYALFARYQGARHGDGDMVNMTFDDYRAMVEDTPVATNLVEFRTGDGRLAAGSVIDQLTDGLSAVYTFFAPERARTSPGSFSILWQIDRCRARGLPYLYLGYWIEDSAKMSYKARFQPLEALRRDGWLPFEASAAPNE
jgi:arginine-tRNA-protein transferase